MTQLPAPEILAAYFEGGLKMPTYDSAVEMYRALAVHTNGQVPQDLINANRPNESDEVKSYRMNRYRPVTKSPVGRVLQSLGKIWRARDWKIQYPEDKFPKVPQDETLQNYCEENFPHYNSITNWTFTVLLKAYCMDANHLILITPLEKIDNLASFNRPYPTLFMSDQVIEYKAGNFAILKSSVQVKVPNHPDSDKYFVVTDKDILPYIKRDKTWELQAEEIINHNLGYLPIVKPRGQYNSTIDRYDLFESRICDMVPHLDDAACEYSDRQAAMIMHIYPERWEMMTQECNTCQGSGKVANPAYTGTDTKSKQLAEANCTVCNGVGATRTIGPYGVTKIRPTKALFGEQPVPMPPMGYVEKDMGIMEFLDKSIETHLYRALSSVNMQFLAQTPLSISGDAKMVDRDELNNFVFNVASDLIYMMNCCYSLFADYRYRVSYPNAADRAKMLPTIPIPRHYELGGSDAILEQLVKIKTDTVGRTTTRALKKDLLNSKYQNMPDLLTVALLELDLDPYDGIAETDLAQMKLSDGLSDSYYIIHCNISPFIQQALEENTDFAKMEIVAQRKILEGYAQEIIAQKEDNMIKSQPLQNDTTAVTPADDTKSDNDVEPTEV